MAETLSAGRSYALVQTTAYVLPPKVVRIHATQLVDISLDNTNWAGLGTTSTTGAETAAIYVRCTTATNCVIAIKVLG